MRVASLKPARPTRFWSGRCIPIQEGCSAAGRMAAGIIMPSAGRVLFAGRDLAEASRREKLKIQMVFQDPQASLNPRMRAADIVGEAPLAHGLIKRREWADYVGSQLQRVGLD